MNSPGNRRHSKVRMVHAPPHSPCNGVPAAFKMTGFGGRPIEVDETFIGGKIKNMHASNRAKLNLG